MNYKINDSHTDPFYIGFFSVVDFPVSQQFQFDPCSIRKRKPVVIDGFYRIRFDLFHGFRSRSGRVRRHKDTKFCVPALRPFRADGILPAQDAFFRRGAHAEGDARKGAGVGRDAGGWEHLPHMRGGEMSVGHCGVSAGHCGASAGHCGASAGHCGASVGHCEVSIGHCGASAGRAEDRPEVWPS